MSFTNLSQPSTRHYKVSNRWLERYKDDKNRYVDIDEIRKNPAGSQYLQDLIAMGIITPDELSVHQIRASFVDNGFMANLETYDDYIFAIRGILKDDGKFIDTLNWLPWFKHDLVYKRIYAHETTARDLAFLGFSSKVYTGTDATSINEYGIVK